MDFADMSKEELLKALHASQQEGMESDSAKLSDQSLDVYVSGIAHEYNNLLTAIIGNLSLAKMYAKPGYEVYDVLSEAEKASFRIKELTIQLLAFVQGSRFEKKVLSLKESLESWICSALADSQVKLEFSIDEDLWSVETDELQLRKVIENAVMNGRNPLSGGGVLRVRIQNVELLSSPAGTRLEKGKYILIAIDNKRDGLYEVGGDMEGVYFCTGSIQQVHRTADSNSGNGAISIYIPASLRTFSFDEAGKTFSSGMGRILVMDDEEIVRLVAGKLLNQCGYEAELAQDGEEMLTAYKNALRAGNPFHAVIMDVGIRKGMGGQEAIRHLLEIDPHAKAIVSSGYAHTPVMSRFKEFGFAGFLAKPYRLEELGRILHEALSGKKE
jgi:two-component system, cell cycle sensor histidine kinase and response regulator CckA